MPDSHDGERPSRSPGCTTCNWYRSEVFQSLTIQISHVPTLSFSDRSHAMPDPEHNKYANKESTKVNNGLDFGGSSSKNEHDTRMTRHTSTINNNVPAMDVDFSQIDLPNLPPAEPPTVDQLVSTLLHPPLHAFPHSVLSIQWVLGALGRDHLVFRDCDERYVLNSDSGVRIQGTSLGLPAVLLEWLCGDEVGSSPTEQGMLLTREFFEVVNAEKRDANER